MYKPIFARVADSTNVSWGCNNLWPQSISQGLACSILFGVFPSSFHWPLKEGFLVLFLETSKVEGRVPIFQERSLRRATLASLELPNLPTCLAVNFQDRMVNWSLDSLASNPVACFACMSTAQSELWQSCCCMFAGGREGRQPC